MIFQLPEVTFVLCVPFSKTSARALLLHRRPLHIPPLGAALQLESSGVGASQRPAHFKVGRITFPLSYEDESCSVWATLANGACTDKAQADQLLLDLIVHMPHREIELSCGPSRWSISPHEVTTDLFSTVELEES